MKFLVIRFSSLGDIIQSTAFLKKLRRLYPKGKIYYVTKESFKEILDGQPYIDKVIGLKESEGLKDLASRIGKIHCVFDLHNNLRSNALILLLKPYCVKRVNKHVLYRRLLVLKFKSVANLVKRKTYDNIDDQLVLLGVKDNEITPEIVLDKVKTNKVVIGMAPGAKWQTKMWPMQYFKALAKKLQKNNITVYLFGSKDEIEIAEFIKDGLDNVESYVGRLSIKETAKMMSACKVFISNDSALMHLAVALNIPTIALFGPTVREFGFFPRGKSVVIEKNLKCRPCSLHGSEFCPIGTHECLESIYPEEVYAKVMQWLR